MGAQWRVHTSGQNDELIRLSNVNGAHQGLYLGVDKTSGDVVSTVLGNPGVHVDFNVNNMSREQVEAHLAKREKSRNPLRQLPLSMVQSHRSHTTRVLPWCPPTKMSLHHKMQLSNSITIIMTPQHRKVILSLIHPMNS